MTIRSTVAVAVLVAGVLLLPEASWACAVCFGAEGAPMTEGLNKGILALMACIGMVYVGIGKVIWDIRKRRKNLQDPTELRLIRGGKR